MSNTDDQEAQEAQEAQKAQKAWTESIPQGLVVKDRYVIERRLGVGGIGTVYLARDKELHGRQVVVKVLSEESLEDAYLKRKFRQEKEALSRINHPGIVHVFDSGELENGMPFLVLEYVSGITLRAALRERPHGMELERAAYIAQQMGRALTLAHELGIFHRDLKPENVMLEDADETEERVKIIDFGIATVKDSQFAGRGSKTRIAGSLPYMAPEQLRGRPAASSDIYAMGIIVYEMVTGRTPFDPASPQQLYLLQNDGVKTMPVALRPDLPPPAQDAVLKALAFEPSERYRRARDFGDEVASALTVEPSVVPPKVEGDTGSPGVEIAHVLFMDLVGFSKLKGDEQASVQQELQSLVMATAEFRRASAEEQLISIPTGDGMALAFFNKLEAPVRCAMEVARAIRTRPRIRLRMGVHSGPVSRVRDIANKPNVLGGGITLAQRVMDCGDAGHILLSKTAADFLGESTHEWAGSFRDLGEHAVKHGVRVHLFSLVTADAGNEETPEKLRAPDPLTPPPPPSEISGPPPPPENLILAQTLAVSHRRDAQGREALMYAPAPWNVGEAPPYPVFVSIRTSSLQRQIEDVRGRVEELTHRALLGQKRDGFGVDEAALALSRAALPPAGFASLLKPGVHPQLYIIQDAAAEVPWEVLEESYLSCREGHRSNRLEADQKFCPQCGKEVTRAGGKLALTYHVTHLVPGQGRPGSDGSEFLFIVDPTEDLMSATKDPAGTCRHHVVELKAMIEQQGFTVNVIQGKAATATRVLKAVSDPSLLGLYYFGHGFLPKDSDQGCLLLSDRELFASEIEEREPAVRFVFLNACEGASAGRTWDLEKSHQSVAGAFARGGSWKVVIAPLWPVVNVQAAEMALDFFRSASVSSPCAEALKAARTTSFKRYEAGEPHLGWMAYRYFGDPNRPLPLPVGAPAVISEDVPTVYVGRVFDANWKLNPEVFSFAIDDVLLRAAKRRNQQERALVSATDLIAGLVRRGDLLRAALRELEVDPDAVYGPIVQEVETDSTAAAGAAGGTPGGVEAENQDLNEAKLRELMAKWIVRDHGEFHPDVVQILKAADHVSQTRESRPDERRVSEADLLDSVLEDEAWKALVPLGLPPAAEVARVLEELARSGEVDENGRVSLAGLDADARRVVETAHALAQQRGACPITHRLLFAAFLSENQGYAAERLRERGQDPEFLFLLMIAAAEATGEPNPRSFGLSPEACGWIVTPVIHAARKNVAAGELVTEKALLNAFCQVAAPSFKQLLKEPPLSVDLDGLQGSEVPPVFEVAEGPEVPQSPQGPEVSPILDSLDSGARRIVERAHALAQKHGAFPVSNRAMLCAFFEDSNGHATALARKLGQAVPSPGTRELWMESAPANPPGREFPLTSEACERAITPMVHHARAILGGQGLVSEAVLFKAFCDVAPRELKSALKAPPWNLDLDALGAEVPRTAEIVIEDPAVKRDQWEDEAWRILIESAGIARLQGWNEIRTPHLFVALVGDGSRAVGAALKGRVALEELKHVVLALVPMRAPTAEPSAQRVGGGAPTQQEKPSVVTVSENARAVVRRALEISASKGRARITEEDLVSGFFADGGGVVGELLRGAGMAMLVGSQGRVVGGESPAAQSSLLATFGTDLTEKARQGRLAEVVGRDTEIDTALQTLLLIENANPLLVGEAGVGKTAIVEGIAARIAAGRCPKKLQSLRVIELSAGRLVANTRFRGEFEQRIQDLLQEARGNVILFIDEIHTLVGAGGAESGGLDASNMLKAALARGEMRLIGASTPAEHKRTIGRDRALSRRFQLQMIRPPSREATISVLSSRQPSFESHHGVRITEEAKVAAVDLSGRYIVDKQWPAKARDVLEHACVLALTEGAASGEESVRVTPAHVTRVVSRMTGIPVERVTSSDLSALTKLEERIGKRIMGQPEALAVVANAIRRGRQGLADTHKPWGVFLFVGPPGVGKTELAKVLAEEVYGGSEGLIRFDMGDFTEPHSTAKLVGAPPGYVGFDQGAPLVDRLRTHPYSLLLFDEIEHAHENVLAVLLRLLSEGTLEDHEGNLADCRNSIVIMTSNVLDGGRESGRVGFGRGAGSAVEGQSGLRSALEGRFPGKLIDRLDAVVRFNTLSREDLQTIADGKVREVVGRVSDLYGVPVAVAAEVTGFLVARASSESAGARAIQRAVDAELAVPLGAFLSAGKISGGVRVLVRNDAIEIDEVPRS